MFIECFKTGGFSIKKCLYGIAMLTILTSAALIIQVGYWLLYPYRLVEFREGHGEIITPVVQTGGYVSFRINRCKYDKFVHRLNTQFVDGIVYWTPEIITTCEPGCREGIEKVYIPKTLSEGEYYLNRTITIKVNPLRTESISYRTGRFQVVERSD